MFRAFISAFVAHRRFFFGLPGPAPKVVRFAEQYLLTPEGADLGHGQLVFAMRTFHFDTPSFSINNLLFYDGAYRLNLMI